LVHVPLPALRSFPTRRSSDLLLSPGYGKTSSPHTSTSFWVCGCPWVKCSCSSGRTSYPLCLAGLATLLSGYGKTPYNQFLGLLADRKSTRLNSSHVSISYAVF